jgi:pSer/pThr/pTyr-binding forkhead associated (FHA) protein
MMPPQAQIEIISPDGDTRFLDLDPAKGVVNIGRHPDNDIIIDSPGVAPFHAVLDHRQKPYQIMLLTEEGDTRLKGQRLVANVFQPLDDWDTIEIDGYAIILLEGEGAPVRPVPVPPPPLAPAPVGVEMPVPGAPLPGVPALGPEDLGIPVGAAPDHIDPLILTDISAREWVVDVDQTISFQVSVTNGGDIVAAFDLRLEGLEADWVSITPPQFNLYEGAQANIAITVTPPRMSSSLAGIHPLAVVVTSPNYPGRFSRMGATLTINPYYDFVVGELTPKDLTVTYRRRTGETAFLLHNKGNSETSFRMEGQDDERALSFEFEVPGEDARLVRQAEMRLGPDESYSVPVSMTPFRRRLIAFRSRRYSFTITSSMAEGALMPRSVMGRLKSRPLIGPGLLLLMIVGLIALIGFLFMPSSEPALAIDDSSPLYGNAVKLTYDASRWVRLGPNSFFNALNGIFLNLTLEYRPRDAGEWQVLRSPSELEVPDGAVSDVPLENGIYRLRNENWLSLLIPPFEGMSREVSVYLTPVDPDIEQFAASPEEIMEGQDVLLFWRVYGAETLVLEYDGLPETLEGAELLEGQRRFTLEEDTIFTLTAGNTSGAAPVQEYVEVKVIHPTATPVPTPVIVRFDVNPLEIMEGETVQIDWQVEGADTVSIEPGYPDLSLEGSIPEEPTGLTNYQLTAIKFAPDGTQVKNSSSPKSVVVNPLPTATAVPLAPEIQLFDVSPPLLELAETESGVVTATWRVAGNHTNIEITAPNYVTSGLSLTGTTPITVRETTLFILAAYNGELSRVASAEVEVVPPPTPTPTPTPLPPPTPVPINIEGFSVEPEEVYPGEEVKLSWQVTGDADNIEVSSPSFKHTNLPSQGFLIEPVNETTLFVLTVSQGDQVLEEAVQVVVLPLPRIIFFKAKETDPSTGDVTCDYTGTPIVCQVDAGAGIVLEWETEGAEAVTLNGEPQSTSGESTVTRGDLVQSYELVADNLKGKQAAAYIDIQVTSPPPPYNVDGEVVAADAIKITWSYKTQDREKIEGFRIYRADVIQGGGFKRVGDEIAPTEDEWEDAGLDRTCGLAYYVVAVYIDPILGEQETPASVNSWYSPPCNP